MYRKTFIEINLNNLYNNVKKLTDFYKYKYYIGVVKGSCYGHGEYIVNTLVDAGINYLAISSLEEAIKLRKYNKDTPILCLEPIDMDYLNICIENNIAITLHDYNYFKDLINLKLNGVLKIHLKIDTGMNRLGIKSSNQINEIYNKLIENKNFYLEGIYTHFGTSGVYDKTYDNQVDRFNYLTKDIDLSKIPIVHLNKSVNVQAHTKMNYETGVRLGIVMYGYNQLNGPMLNTFRQKLRYYRKIFRNKRLGVSKTIKKCNLELKPSYKLVSEVIQVKKINKGDHVGYGEVFTAQSDGYVATIPIGYADGFSLDNTGRTILINDKRYKIIDIVMMGMITALVDETVKVHDRVVLMGDDISILEVSIHNHSTQYETLCRANSNVPRVYIKDNKILHIEE
ncbi:MAG: alanine racemase [Clostridium sp.]|nr:alanine racemase [Clostridium sp.]MCM1443931.1 alanine racemase [Candidatus Amulumruptor caecigallinarius]